MKQFRAFLYLTIYACLRLWFLDMDTNPGLQHPVPTICRILCSNVRGMDGNLSDPTVASSRYDMLLCSDTLVSDMCHKLEFLVTRFCCRLVMPGQDA